MSYNEEVAEHLGEVLRRALSNGDLHLVMDCLNEPNKESRETLVRVLKDEKKVLIANARRAINHAEAMRSLFLRLGTTISYDARNSHDKKRKEEGDRAWGAAGDASRVFFALWSGPTFDALRAAGVTNEEFLGDSEWKSDLTDKDVERLAILGLRCDYEGVRLSSKVNSKEQPDA